MTWLLDNQAVAVNLDVASKMRSRFIKSSTIGDHFTVEVTSATNTVHNLGMYDTEQEARDWIDAFISS